jgi:DNA-damage-inducible protein J
MIFMASTVPVQTRVDAGVKERAGVILDRMGLTVSDAVRILLTRIANEGALPAGLTTDAVAHDAWFRAKVQEALDDPRPGIPHEEARATMAEVRANALRREQGGL